MTNRFGLTIGALCALSFASAVASAACKDIKYDELQSVANGIVPGDGAAGGAPSGGLDFPMWVTMVDETGKVCHVVNTAPGSGARSNQAWLGSRVISAQKANTANAFSIDSFAISTAMLYGTVLEQGSLYGLQHSNPVDASAAYLGSPNTYGTNGDPLKNKRVGGVNVFGGGLALYKGGKKIGALGVSGDTSCTDHVVAWKIRAQLGMGGPNSDALTAATPVTPNTFQHPTCLNMPDNSQDGGSIDGN